MPATKDQKQFLHSLACYLAKDHDGFRDDGAAKRAQILDLSLIHISEPTRPY